MELLILIIIVKFNLEKGVKVLFYFFVIDLE